MHITGSFEHPLMVSLPTLLRLSAVLNVLAGVAHLAIPDRLLKLASWNYDRVLAVGFEPRPNATRRVRLIGVAMIAAAPVLTRLASLME